MAGAPRIVVMGRVVAPYGVQGWLKVRPFTQFPEALLAHASWRLGTEGAAWRTFRVLEARLHGDLVVAQLRGLHRREDAAAWRGAAVGIPRSALPALAEGEIYLEDVLGLEVVNREGTALGRVAGFVDTGAHPVLKVVQGKLPLLLIPLVPAHVDAIDLAAGRIIVDWQADY